MIALVCYASNSMVISQEKLVVSSLKFGVDKTFSYGKESIDPLFYSMNQKTLDSERGAGFWLWKPYVINKALHSGYLHEGDYLIYSDAGIEIVNDVSHLINGMDEDLLLFSNGWKHVEWCKMNVANTISGYSIDGDDAKEHPDFGYYHRTQVQASVIFFKVTDKAKAFIKEWLLWCQMPGFIDDSPSKLPNFPTFAEHRHDQAILTCLQIKHGYKLHWWPTIYSEHIRPGYEDKYPAMFNHHRKRNNEW